MDEVLERDTLRFINQATNRRDVTFKNRSDLLAKIYYDANGNRTSSMFGTAASTVTVSSSSNRITSVMANHVTTPWSYDADGSATMDGANTYTFDATERMTVSNPMPLGMGGTYRYNGLGERVGKTAVMTTTDFLYEGSGALLGEYSGTNYQETIRIRGVPILLLTNAGTFYIATDHLNAPRAIVNSSNQLRWDWNPTTPFGIGTANQNPAGLGAFVFNQRFPGQHIDMESGNFYNYFRDYNSVLGRYVESDPIGLRAGLNTFNYVSANPMSSIDPRGTAFYVGQHGALFPQDPLQHAVILLDPDNPNDFANNPLFQTNDGTEATLGGQPFGHGVIGLFLGLHFVPNYPGDARCKLHDITLIPTPIPFTDTGFINSLISAASSYKNDLRYDAFPDPFGLFFNSNSFAAGVLEAVGVDPPDLPGPRPGYNHPIPIPH